MPVTSPVAEAVATDGLELDQVTVRPLITLPFASWIVAVSCCVPPSTKVADWGFTVTDAAEESPIVRSAVPVTPPDVAIMVTVPGVTPVTRPAADTVATDGLELDQVTFWPVSKVPSGSLSVATNCCVAPNTKAADCGFT